MAFTAWDLARTLSGGVPQSVPVLLTSGNAIRVGEPLAVTAATGKVVPAPGGADTKAIKYVSQVALASQGADTIIPAYPCTPDMVFRIKQAGSPIVGKRIGLTATDLTGDPTNTTQTQIMSIAIDEVDATIHYCVGVNWLVTTAGA
jgi:hypothetical protein